MRSLPALTCLLALLVALPAAGETAYITDRIVAGLYAAPDLTGEAQRELPTGTVVDVVERGDVASRVRLADGSGGWVRSHYLSQSMPAQSLLMQLAEKHRRVQADLQRLQRAAAANAPPPVSPSLRAWPFAVVGLLCLVIGFALGALWLDRRYRERHGGFRI
jgi:hypothetical protein